MVTDTQLAHFSNLCGCFLILLVILFHYISANADKVKRNPSK